jgi:hypothetical protein
MGEVPRSNPQASPFYYVVRKTQQSANLVDGDYIWRRLVLAGATKMADVLDMAITPPNLGGSCYYIIFLFFGHELSLGVSRCHVVPVDWAMWQRLIGPPHCLVTLMSHPHQLCTRHVAALGWFHVASSGGATWHFSTSRHRPMKILLASGT